MFLDAVELPLPVLISLAPPFLQINLWVPYYTLSERSRTNPCPLFLLSPATRTLTSPSFVFFSSPFFVPLRTSTEVPSFEQVQKWSEMVNSKLGEEKFLFVEAMFVLLPFSCSTRRRNSNLTSRPLFPLRFPPLQSQRVVPRVASRRSS